MSASTGIRSDFIAFTPALASFASLYRLQSFSKFGIFRPISEDAYIGLFIPKQQSLKGPLENNYANFGQSLSTRPIAS
jgi:hypothetical protein